MADVFLSSSSKDRVRIERVARALVAAGHTVWWDRDVPVGSDFSEEIQREIAAAKAVVVCWSEASCASKWVRDEAAYARDRDKLIPIVIEPVEAPLGFRQIQTLDFTLWKGDSASPAFATLDAAIRRMGGLAAIVPGARAGVAESASRARKQTIAIAAVAAAALVVVGFLALRMDRSPPPQEIARTGQLLDPALAALERSPRPEERMAYNAFVGGDERAALSTLERLASELDSRGEKAAAAEVYNRVGALGLLVDQARGLAARRKAAELAPASQAAFQGLFFDTLLILGPDAAEGIAAEAMDVATDNGMRAFIQAHLAILAADIRRDPALAEERLSRIRALEPAGDAVIRMSLLWSESLIAAGRDDLVQSKAAIDESHTLRDAFSRASDAPFMVVVVEARYHLAAGDWPRSFELAAKSFDERRRRGEFVPTPLLQTACLAGLHAGRIEEAVPYCEATRSFEPSLRALFLGELAAARGDLVEARAEVDASRAIAGEAANSQLIRLEAQIAAKQGEFDTAQTLLWRHLDELKGQANERSRRATALRLFGGWMIEADEPQRACAALMEARVLYGEIGGEPGAAAAASMLRDASCQDNA